MWQRAIFPPACHTLTWPAVITCMPWRPPSWRCRCCACYGKKHFADEAPFAASSPSKGREGAAAAARLSGGEATAKNKPVLNVAVDARAGVSPRSPGAE